MSSKIKAGYRLAIVNPMTLVGMELKTLLHDRGLPYQSVTLLASSEEEHGAVTEVLDEPAFVKPISSEELEEQDLVFFCGSGDDNRPWIEQNVVRTFIAIDLSQPSVVEGLPVVAGVNSDRIENEQMVIISPHPAATPIVLVLHTLRRVAEIELCAATVIQPASELGRPGIDELLQQTISVLNVQSVPKQVFGRQLAFNLYPAAEAARDEPYVMRQVREVLGADNLPLSLSLVQGTVFHGYTFALFLKLGGAVNRAGVIDGLRANTSIEIADEDEPFSTVDSAGRDEILVGRVHADTGIPGAFWIWLVADNVRRASALNAVMIAEAVLQRFRPITN